MTNKTGYTFNWGELSEDEFIAEYWQKKPLLIRAALKDFVSPLSADELAGLSLTGLDLEDNLPSRIITDTPTQDKKSVNWATQHGPFSETHFSSLPESNWTLLVQQVDQYLPDVAAIRDSISFIPQWRCEDVMVSYAADQGSVGPHFDYYDVFLLQGEGSRLWRVGQHCDSNSPLLANCDMRILSEFDAQEDFLVYPGDVLYIPPGIAHWGIAQGECLTYSIGFRAPSHAEILLDFSAEMAAKLSEDQRYKDPAKRIKGRDQSEIHAEVIESLHQTMLGYLGDKKQLALWFGQYMTQTHRSEDEAYSTDIFNKQRSYRLADECRSAYVENGEAASVFINGDTFSVKLATAQALCLGETLHIDEAIYANDLATLSALFQRNWLITSL